MIFALACCCFNTHRVRQKCFRSNFSLSLPARHFWISTICFCFNRCQLSKLPWHLSLVNFFFNLSVCEREKENFPIFCERKLPESTSAARKLSSCFVWKTKPMFGLQHLTHILDSWLHRHANSCEYRLTEWLAVK